MFSPFDYEMMAHAIRLAKKGINNTSPNPRVGCVIVNPVEQKIIGEGFHAKAGEAHAEIQALKSVEQSSLGGECENKHAQGAHVYVTLEPCSHTGKTGPCADALIQAKVARVIFAMEDPNPEVAGRGIEKLREAGIQVEGPVNEEQAIDLNPGFIKRMRHGMPYVRCKMAMSVDGRTAMASGESKWITGPAAREDVQKIRARSCAIVTGVDSVIFDDPALTVRLGENDRQPLRVILDTHGRCPKKADILSQPGRTIIACGESSSIDDDRELWPLPEKNGRPSLVKLLTKLAQEGCNEVLLETGATLAGAFVAEGLVDEFIIYMAPKFMGSSARPLFQLPIDKMNGQLPLSITDIRVVGEDWRICAKPDPEG